MAKICIGHGKRCNPCKIVIRWIIIIYIRIEIVITKCRIIKWIICDKYKKITRK